MLKFGTLNENYEAILIPLDQTMETPKTKEMSVNHSLEKILSSITDWKEFKGKLGELLIIYPFQILPNIKRVILVGIGKKSDLSLEKIRRAFGKAGNTIRKHKLSEIGIIIPNKLSKYSEGMFEGLFLGNYKFQKYKTVKNYITPNLASIISISDNNIQNMIESAYHHSDAIIQGTYLARDLGNSPSNIITPTYLAEEAKKLSELGIKINILNLEGIKKEEMNLFLAVAKGSLDTEPPVFIIMDYIPEKSYNETLVLVGKGITFDTGGITLKPGEGMGAMIFDMCGAGAVIGTMKTIGLLRPKIRIIGLIPATPNVPDANSYRPGDIIQARSGKQVEIISTDAEGRNILADTLDFAKKYKPNLVLDLATLTGGAVIALGHLYAALYANEKAQKFQEKILQAAINSGESCWPMPLDEDYLEYLKSDHADLKHSGGRWGSSITAAKFLEQFTDYPWIHIDIAGTAWKGGTMGGKTNWYNATNGATGYGVRLITELIRLW